MKPAHRAARVLVVDDDPGVAQTFGRLLEIEGHQVRAVLSAKAGLAEAEAIDPDAIILDFRMPLTDGIGFLRRLRTLSGHRDTPVTIVTGDYFIDDALLADIASLGADVRFKPLWAEDLAALAESMIAGPRRPPVEPTPS
jgi:CheY-like chemotaxis protein